MKTVKIIWHYGNDYRVSESSANTYVEAIRTAIPDIPDKHVSFAVSAMFNGGEYRGWSWYTITPVEA